MDLVFLRKEIKVYAETWSYKMRYLVDTNTISELVKAKPDKQVIKWFNAVSDRDLCISVLTLGEIRKGLIKIDNESKREKIRFWLEHELSTWFGDRILPIDQEVAHKWGMLQAQNRTLPAIDSLIAATALHYDLIIVTRNTKDFNELALEVINPFLKD